MKTLRTALCASMVLSWAALSGATEPGRKPEKGTKSVSQPTTTPASPQRPNPAAATAGGSAKALQTSPLPAQPSKPVADPARNPKQAKEGR